MKAHFDRFAAYNAWANARLFAACAALPEADLRRDLGAAFGSLLGTLNHLLVTDVIWAARLRGQAGPPWALDHVAHEDFAELTAAREAMDADLIRLVGELTEADMGGQIRYARVSDPSAVIVQPRAEALAHLFNHQTHHRGQAHALLTRLTGTAPPLDLLFFQRETA